jgi:hypothetical protein
MQSSAVVLLIADLKGARGPTVPVSSGMGPALRAAYSASVARSGTEIYVSTPIYAKIQALTHRDG